MTDYLMKIRLLSDLCVADGGIYNSSIDTDICYDSYGLPFIPAKRIKGCLRECGIELRDWGEELPLVPLLDIHRMCCICLLISETRHPLSRRAVWRRKVPCVPCA